MLLEGVANAAVQENHLHRFGFDGIRDCGRGSSYSAFRRGAAADASPASELLSEVPPGATTLIYLDLAAVRTSSFYQHRPDTSPITLPDRDYANFIAVTGFDFEKDLDQVVIASWPQSLVQDQKKTIVFAEGRFDRQKIHDYAMQKGKLIQEQGREVFVFPAGVATRGPGRGGAGDSSRGSLNETAESTSLVFLNDHRIALVEGSSIAPLLATRSVAGVDPMRARAAGVAGAAAFVISRVPTIPDNFFSEEFKPRNSPQALCARCSGSLWPRGPRATMCGFRSKENALLLPTLASFKRRCRWRACSGRRLWKARRLVNRWIQPHLESWKHC